MRAETNDGVGVTYRTIGEGKRALVFVHGWMMSGAVFEDLAAALDTTDLKLVLLDLRGAGDSDRPESGYTLQRFADDVCSVIDHAGLTRPIVVGHSMGGQVAQLVAASRPDTVAGLILINPVPATGLPLPDDAAALFRGSATDRDKQGVILDIACKQLSPAAKARLVGVAATVSPSCIGESLDAWVTGGTDTHLAAIRAPTLVLASDDEFIPRPLLREQVVDKIKGARLAWLPGSGHYAPAEQPAAVAAVVDAFVAGVRPVAASPTLATPPA